MFKIEVECTGERQVIRLIGRIRLAHVDGVAGQIAGYEGHSDLDLRDVTIVDIDVVRYLLSCEKTDVGILNCPLYIREWIHREAGEHRPDLSH